ncbi:hypothetical protein M404DRAFT_34857 [Pisolithus tinctorius Marx 270]|uniref:Chromo domain-containing protein n=1 Tax=Pisolithus tinctorius Marx 270 TaxID=870435 RepID=A0A0C3N0H6_PISTI|nr:hypothetical protein M404DRAFT_34857 [Pisolithus tinctorius Marx 270]
MFHASKLTPFVKTKEYGPAQPPPPPELVGDENEWEVKAILKHKCACKVKSSSKEPSVTLQQKYHYLVKWLGYLHFQNSWESKDNLINAPEVLRDEGQVMIDWTQVSEDTIKYDTDNEEETMRAKAKERKRQKVAEQACWEEQAQLEAERVEREKAKGEEEEAKGEDEPMAEAK